MKTAKEWVAGWPHAHTSCVYVDEDDVEAIQADARAEGRREGLLEAMVAVREADSINDALGAVRKLVEAEKGGGG